MSDILEVRELRAYYGRVQALHGIDLSLREGSVTTLLGANGAGKTTTLRSICSMVHFTGAIRFDGLELGGRSTEKLVRLGIAHVPQGRGTFSRLTVEENLRLGAISRSDSKGIANDIDRMYAHFPKLKQRRSQHFFRQAAELGLAGVYVPEAYGGAGMDMVSYCVAIEEISRVCASSGVILSVNNSLVCDPLLRYGNDEQKRDFLTPLAAGRKLGCFALTEPEAGSDAAALKTTAKRDGDDYILNGSKVFITNGTHADTALVFATVDPALKHRGITAFIVAMDSPGFSRGHHEYKLGVQASGTTKLYFDNLRVPARQRLGEEGKSFGVAMSSLDGGRIGLAPPGGSDQRTCHHRGSHGYGHSYRNDQNDDLNIHRIDDIDHKQDHEGVLT